MEPLRDWLIELGWSVESATAAGVAVGLLVAYLVGATLRGLTRGLRERLLEPSKPWQEAVRQRRVVPRLAWVIVIATASVLVIPLLEPWPRASRWSEALLGGLLVLAIVVAVSGFLAALFDVLQHNRNHEQRLPVKAMAQATQVALWTYGALALLSILSGKDLWAVMTGLTAIGAVLVYVFRDPILGWTAAVQIAANDLVREGDWIDVPARGANGRVEEIALTSIKVRNWDKTVTAIPTYTVFSEGFRNMSGMFEAGVRRIKRAIAIDATSVRFCDDELIERLRRSPSMPEPGMAQESRGGEHDPLSDPRPTNLECFRGWLQAWLERHSGLEKSTPILVRELQPTGRGIPVEFYAYSTDVRWLHYEKLQAEILDRILGVLPHFDLRPYQQISDQAPSSRALPAGDPGLEPTPRGTPTC